MLKIKRFIDSYLQYKSNINFSLKNVIYYKLLYYNLIYNLMLTNLQFANFMITNLEILTLTLSNYHLN